MSDTATKPRSRSGGRAARRSLRTAADFTMLPGLTRNIPQCEVMDPAQVERIDTASMDILENVGVHFRDAVALEDWKRVGAKVVGETVYLDRGLVRELIATIPSDFTYHARNPAKNVHLGGKHSVFVPMTGAPFLRDLDDVRRNPTLDDLAMFHKLSHMLPGLHSSAHHIVEPYDHPISQRHLRITYSSMKYSDKTFMGMTTSPKNAEDVMEMCAILFGEDVARKGGVYHVTADLTKRFGVGRVFNTLLDETTILGLAMGAGHAGLLPFPEIQYLAYLMNAIDQLRGEAGSMQFFSNDQYQNPMVVRIAGLAYQRGFGGHFHNDNGIAALREIPGLLIGCPARGDDAVRMLRTLAATARGAGRPTIFIEPIALYMTKDLHEDGDGAWLTHYPDLGDAMPVGEIGVYHEEATDLCIATYANGLYMSLRVAERLRAEGISCRVVDLRWLAPLPIDALRPHAEACGKLLVVDECRANSGIADTVVADIVEGSPSVRTHRVRGKDCYIPLGAAANLVLVQEHDIEAGIRHLLES